MSGWYARNRHRYGDDWPEIAKAVKDDAEWCCEACGHPHGPSPYVLTVDHLDGVPEHMEPANLMALCQSCHLIRQGLTRGGRLAADASRFVIAAALLAYRATRTPPANILDAMADHSARGREWWRYNDAIGRTLLLQSVEAARR